MSKALISWTPPQDAFADEFEVYSRAQGAREWESRDSTRGTSIELLFPAYGTFEIAVAPRTAGVLAGPESWTILVFSPENLDDIAAPAAVTNLAAGQDGNVVRLHWDPLISPNIDCYEIRQGGSWEEGLVRDRIPYPRASASIGIFAAEATTFLVAVRDHQGRYGAPGSALITFRGAEYGPVQGTHDEAAGPFTGTKAGLVESGGDLLQEALPANGSAYGSAGAVYGYPIFGLYRNGGTYVTAWQDVSIVVDERIEVALGYTLTKGASAGADWAATVRPEIDGLGAWLDPGARSPYSYISGDGTLLDGLDVKIEIDTAQDGTPTPDGWRVWVPGATYRYRQVRLRFTLLCPWPFFTIQVTDLSWKRRRENRKDEGSILIPGTGGTDIVFATDFTVAPYMTGVLVHASDVAFATFSNVTTSGCKVRLWDATGAEVGSGTVHWHALGV